jgi:hypothetical protein
MPARKPLYRLTSAIRALPAACRAVEVPCRVDVMPESVIAAAEKGIIDDLEK